MLWRLYSFQEKHSNMLGWMTILQNNRKITGCLDGKCLWICFMAFNSTNYAREELWNNYKKNNKGLINITGWKW